MIPICYRISTASGNWRSASAPVRRSGRKLKPGSRPTASSGWRVNWLRPPPVSSGTRAGSRPGMLTVSSPCAAPTSSTPCSAPSARAAVCPSAFPPRKRGNGCGPSRRSTPISPRRRRTRPTGSSPACSTAPSTPPGPAIRIRSAPISRCATTSCLRCPIRIRCAASWTSSTLSSPSPPRGRPRRTMPTSCCRSPRPCPGKAFWPPSWG